MPTYNDVIRRFETLVKGKYYPTPNAFGDAVGLTPTEKTKIYKALGKKHIPSADSLLLWLDKLGAKVVFPDEVPVEAAKEVQFSHPHIIQGSEARSPESSDYLAVPLAAGAVAAGRGLVPEDSIRGWVLVWRHQDSIRFRKNLIAVEVGKNQDSMMPTIFPGDILLVDRDDFHTGFKGPGNIFLCREPKADEIMVKRVLVQKSNGGNQVMFYSDNAIDYPPQVFSLEEHYGGEIARAVIGRVVWCWSDMSRR